jgi:hypothetical protein
MELEQGPHGDGMTATQLIADLITTTCQMMVDKVGYFEMKAEKKAFATEVGNHLSCAVTDILIAMGLNPFPMSSSGYDDDDTELGKAHREAMKDEPQELNEKDGEGV